MINLLYYNYNSDTVAFGSVKMVTMQWLLVGLTILLLTPQSWAEEEEPLEPQEADCSMSL